MLEDIRPLAVKAKWVWRLLEGSLEVVMKHRTRASDSLRAMLAEWRTKGSRRHRAWGASGKDCRERSPPRPRSDQEASLWNGLLRFKRPTREAISISCIFGK